MASQPGFGRYLARAFSARPLGMVVPPNWIGLAAMGMLGLVNPGFWVLGAGLEIGYLLVLATNQRFQRTVAAQSSLEARGGWDTRIARTLATLDPRERRRYQDLVDRCRSILDLQMGTAAEAPHGLDAQQEGLGRLTWMYLRLLAARHTIEHVLQGANSDQARDLARERDALDRRLATDALSAELRRSLEGQAEILRQRLARRGEADQQLAYIDAELTRIEHQVELIREQAALSTDPELLSQRIDEIAATLGGTSQWIRDQRQVFGAMDDLLVDTAPPSITRAKESE
jgi:hypothetical protein